MKPVLVTSGEPAGVGPDLCLTLAQTDYPVVVMGAKKLLAARAKQLGLSVKLCDYDPHSSWQKGQVTIFPIACAQPVTAGKLNPANAAYVLEMLTVATERCLLGEFSALVTAPVHKANINDAGYAFTGHTEFFRDACQVGDVVMLLACDAMKVALLTTHMPLRAVPDAISSELMIKVVRILDAALKRDFGIAYPKIRVAGLNPHAGENGYLGREEQEVITPALIKLQEEGFDIQGPFAADTLFTDKTHAGCDVFLAMYHDQGLSVLKYAGFGQAVNITLGLPIIRTSVDHGTALSLAGTGLAEASSLVKAVTMAQMMAKNRGV